MDAHARTQIIKDNMGVVWSLRGTQHTASCAACTAPRTRLAPSTSSDARCPPDRGRSSACTCSSEQDRPGFSFAMHACQPTRPCLLPRVSRRQLLACLLHDGQCRSGYRTTDGLRLLMDSRRRMSGWKNGRLHGHSMPTSAALCLWYSGSSSRSINSRVYVLLYFSSVAGVRPPMHTAYGKMNYCLVH